MKDVLTIGALARRVDMNTSAIRYYEAQGILHPATRLPSGYRAYGEDAVSALRFVQRAKQLCLSLVEIKGILDLTRRGQPPCECVQELVQHHLRQVDAKIEELLALRGQLQGLLRREPTRRNSGEICPIIECDG